MSVQVTTYCPFVQCDICAFNRLQLTHFKMGTVPWNNWKKVQDQHHAGVLADRRIYDKTR